VKNKIKAVIFDMDGVLLDAKEWHYNALKKALGLFGYEMTRYDHLMTYDGLPTKKKLEMYSKEYNLPVSLHSFINDLKQSYTIDEIFLHAKPNFRHEQALSYLKQNSFKLGLGSNSIRETVELAMKKAALFPYFDLILSNQDILSPKPNPEMYNKIISRFELQPNECLIIEDNEHGITAAKESGAHVLIVQSVNDVNLENILNKIQELENA
jgi:beta-phosphoglucomutase-like phosphatase (HAD superfamily)